MKLVDLESEGLQPWPVVTDHPSSNLTWTKTIVKMMMMIMATKVINDNDMLMIMMTPIRKMLAVMMILKICGSLADCGNELTTAFNRFYQFDHHHHHHHHEHDICDELWKLASFRFKLSDDEHWFLSVHLMQGHWSSSNILHKSDFSLHPLWQI